MKADPKIRADGLCARDECENELPVLDDPFCSNACCRLWHGVVFPNDLKLNANPPPKKTKHGRHQIPKIPGQRRRIEVNAALK